MWSWVSVLPKLGSRWPPGFDFRPKTGLGRDYCAGRRGAESGVMSCDTDNLTPPSKYQDDGKQKTNWHSHQWWRLSGA